MLICTRMASNGVQVETQDGYDMAKSDMKTLNAKVYLQNYPIAFQSVYKHH